MSRRTSFWLQGVLTACVLLTAARGVRAADTRSVNAKAQEIAGTAEFLRSVPKRFATLQAMDAAKLRVTLLVDGEGLPKVWNLAPDAEVKRFGFWGRLDQFTPGDRVWVWFRTDRARQPVSISMLADEVSEQDIHGAGVRLDARDGQSITIKPATGPNRKLKALGAELYRGQEKASLDALAPGTPIYVQTAGDRARLILNPAAFALRQAEQQAALRQRWIEEGLPGAVVFLHVFSGEMEFMLDHEAMRWARSLQPGDKVTLQASPPINALVRAMHPWRERTQLRLVVAGWDQADLVPGQRLRLKMTPPPQGVDMGKLPPDVDRPRTRTERVEWFLASIYCPCKVKGDGCTGDFYTLASCNPNACGMPSMLRRLVAGKIDRGLTDRQIYEELLKQYGRDLARPHLVP
jgi:hypothetical protein